MTVVRAHSDIRQHPVTALCARNRQGRLAVLVGAALALFGILAGSASATNTVYWSDPYSLEGNVGSATATASGLTALESLDAGTGTFGFGTALDAQYGILFVAKLGEIHWRFLPGTGSTASGSIDSGEDQTIGLSYDSSAHVLYWGDYDSVNYAELVVTASGVTVDGLGDLVSTPEPYGVAVDLPAQRIYWAAGSTIKYRGLRGHEPSEPVTVEHTCGDVGFQGVQVDPAQDRIYAEGAAVWSMALDGSGCSQIATGVGSVQGAAWDPSANRLYFPDHADAFDAEPEYAAIKWAGLPSGGSPGALVLDTTTPTFPVFPAILATPSADAAVTATASSTGIGATLTCGTPAWRPDSPGMALYQAPASGDSFSWTRDGTTVVGTAATMTATEAGTYRCTATASNAAGNGSSSSNDVVIRAPAPTTLVTRSGTITTKSTRSRGTTISTTRLRLATDQTCRSTFVVKTKAGKGVALLPGSTIGAVRIRKATVKPVIVDMTAGNQIAIAAKTRGTLKKGTKLVIGCSGGSPATQSIILKS